MVPFPRSKNAVSLNFKLNEQIRSDNSVIRRDFKMGCVEKGEYKIGNVLEYIECWWSFDTERFGYDVKKAREDAKLTQAEVDLILKRKGTVSGVEASRKDYTPQVETLVLLCNLFELDPRDYWEAL